MTPSGQTARRAGLAAGVATVGATAALLLQRRVVGKLRTAAPAGGETAFGALPADRSYCVYADDGVGLYVEEVGAEDAPLVVVFVHGYTLALGAFHYQRLGLADITHPRVRLVFYDQRSHGRSDRAPSDSCQIDQLGRDLDAVIRRAAGNRAVVLIGHSMGGMTCLALAEQRPEIFGTQVRGVALLSTTTGGLADVDLGLGLPKLVSRAKLLAMPVLARGLRARPKLAEFTRRSGADLSWLLTRWYSFGDPAVSPALVDYVGQLIGATPVEVIADFFSTLMGYNTVTSLSVLRDVETIIVCGDSDRLTPLSHSEAMKAELPDAELVVVTGAGHLALLERPELITLTLRAFVHRAAKRGARSPSRRRA